MSRVDTNNPEWQAAFKECNDRLNALLLLSLSLSQEELAEVQKMLKDKLAEIEKK